MPIRFRTRPGYLLPAIAVVLAFACPGRASATAFFVNQQSVRGLGRVDAGNTVAADELGTIFFNPAGLTKVVQDGRDPDCIRIALGVHLIIPRSQQHDRGSFAATPGTLGLPVPVGGGDARNPTGPTPVPNFYVAKALAGNRGAVGLGVNAPFGLATAFDRDWHGRYDAIEASLRTVNLTLVGAYRVSDRLSLGGGVDLQYARTTLTSAIPNPLAPGGPSAETDASINTKGHDYFTPGFNLGFMYDIDPRTRIGAHYRSGMSHEIEGTSVIEGLQGPLAASNGSVDATAELRLPGIAAVGLRRVATDRLVLLGDFKWFNWSTFDEVRIRFADGRPDGVRTANYRDAYAVAVGAEYQAGPNWTARGGLHYDTTPTVDAFRDTTVPDSERLWVGVGATWQISDVLNMDVGFKHVFFRDTSIDLTKTFFDGTPLATTTNIRSEVRTAVTTVAVDFRFYF